MKITFYFRSHQISASRDSLHLAYDFHYYWQGKNYHHIYKGFMAGIYTKGRIIEKPSITLLEELEKLPESTLIQAYDTGTWLGWIRAFFSGVHAPAIVINSQKFVGLEACKNILQQIS